MDYASLFRPIFAYTAHVAAAAKQPGWLESHALTVKRDLSLLLGSAMQSKTEPLDPNFDQAWFALTAWLHVTLNQLPDGDELANQLVPADQNKNEEFFRRLSLLLTPLPGGYPRDIKEILKVYSLCLDLGYRNESPIQPPGTDTDTMRQRCRDALASPQLAPSASRAASNPFVRIAVSAAVWLLPVAIPLTLYGVYRYFLGTLYSSVVG